MTLLVGIVPVLVTLVYPDPQLRMLWFCKTRGYLFQICLMLSRWFIAFACIDRCALSSDQQRLRHFASRPMTYRVIAVIVVFWTAVCSHRAIFYEIEGNLCGIVHNFGAAMYHSLYVIVGGGVAPTTIMIVCALVIRRNLARKQLRRMQLSTGEPRRNSLDRQVHSLLFMQIICYVIFTIPQLGNLVFNTISITIPNRSKNHLAIEKFVAFFAELMLYLFPVTSFYLYTLTSRTFRSELINRFRFISPLRNRIVPSVEGTIFVHRM